MKSRVLAALARGSATLAAALLGACLPSPVSWSPDSARVAFVDPTGEDDEWSIWVADVDTGACSPLHVSRNGLSAAAWAPKGDRLACLEAPKEKKGRPTLLLLPLEGQPTPHLLAPLLEFADLERTERAILVAGAPSWSPDGRWIAYRAFVRDTGVVRLVRPDGRDPRDIYAGGRHMLRLARQLLNTAHNVKLEWEDRVAASKEADRLLRELPRRFPEAGLAAEIGKLDEELAQFHR